MVLIIDICLSAVTLWLEKVSYTSYRTYSNSAPFLVLCIAANKLIEYLKHI